MNNPINYIRTAAGSLAKSAQVSAKSVSMAVVKDTGSALAAHARASWGHAAIGAGIGGGAGYLNSRSNDPREQITSALKGAGIGAVAGLGMGVARKSWPGVKSVLGGAKVALTDAHAAGMAAPHYVKPGPGPWKMPGSPAGRKFGGRAFPSRIYSEDPGLPTAMTGRGFMRSGGF
jgi:hypothetical protein